MTKAFKDALTGSTALGSRPGPDTTLLAATEVDGVPFEEWVLAAAKSPEGISHMAIQRAAGQGLIATRPYCDMLARANGLRLVIAGGRGDDGSSNNAVGERFRARFHFVSQEAFDRLPVIAGRVEE
jgi:hypothetical protein